MCRSLRSIVPLVLMLLWCGCSPAPLWEVTVLNMYAEPIVLKGGSRRSTEIDPQQARRDWAIKPGETLQIAAGDKVLEEHVGGQPPLSFRESEDGHVFLVAGGPADLVVADYTDFYAKEGEEPIANPEIQLVANMRGKKSVLLERGDEMDFPLQGVQATKYDGGGFKGRRYLRVVAVGAEINDDQLMDYLRYELARQLEEKKAE